MIFDFSPAFERCLRKYPLAQQVLIKSQIDSFGAFLDMGKLPSGFGAKQIRLGLWELRIGLGERLVYWRKGNHILFDFIGSHDEIRRFLKHL